MARTERSSIRSKYQDADRLDRVQNESWDFDEEMHEKATVLVEREIVVSAYRIRANVIELILKRIKHIPRQDVVFRWIV